MISTGENKIYEIAENEAEYKKYRRLLSTEAFQVSDINEILLKKGAEKLSKEELVYVIEDGSEIRKEYSHKMEALMKVRSLKNQELVNGYRSENMIAVKEDKELILLSTEIYSANEDGFQSETKIKQEIIQQVSRALKSQNKELKIIQVKDRGYDAESIFNIIETEKDFFIIRVSHLKRIIEQEGCRKKIEEVVYGKRFEKKFPKIKIKNRVYQDLKIKIEYAQIKLKQKEYSLVKIQLRDREGKSIFAKPMILITNLPINSPEEAFKIYRGYLKRWKIENVFQFIKNTLNWEKFQIRDLRGIKKLVALTFLVASYFYQLGEGIIKEEFVELLAKIGNGKGKITRKALIKGLQTLINSLKTWQSLKINCSEKQSQNLFKELGFGDEVEDFLRCVQF